MEEKKDILKRAYVLYFFMGLFGLAVLVQTLKIVFVEGEELRERAQHLTVDYRTIPAVRGNIYAGDGSLMATSVPIYDVHWDPNAEAITKEIFDNSIDTLAECLSSLFKDKSKREYVDYLTNERNEGSRYTLIRRKVKFTQLMEMRKFPVFKKGRYKGGFLYQQQNRRQRPFRLLAARTIGYKREKAKVGLEAAYNEDLAGIDGYRLMQKLAGGVWKPIESENDVEPEDGADIYTTLDVNIQDVAEDALLAQLQKQDAKYGAVVVMEVKTGEIRAIANLTKTSSGDYYESYNYAIGAATEPGSTFKLASYLALLEDDFIEIDQNVDTGDGKKQFYDRVMKDTKEGGYGVISIEKAFAVSSNIAIASLVDKYYSKDPQRFINRLYQMRLNQQLGMEIPGEGKPYVKSTNDETWSGISLPWMSIGYETQLTPLQVLTFYNAVANKGKMMKPMFVKSVRRHGKVLKEFEPQVLKDKIASDESLKKAKVMLEAVVEEGTGRNLKHADYKIAGKTGTAQISAGKGGYRSRSRMTYQASFCGYFPADDPQYSVIVVVNAPSRGVYYGNVVAGSVFSEISDKIYSTSIHIHDEVKQNQFAGRTLLPVSSNGRVSDLEWVFSEIGVNYDKKTETAVWGKTNTGKDTVAIRNMRIQDGLVPDVYGMNLEDAVYLLENEGLKVQVKGRGMIKGQSIPAGRRIEKGTTITLTLA